MLWIQRSKTRLYGIGLLFLSSLLIGSFPVFAHANPTLDVHSIEAKKQEGGAEEVILSPRLEAIQDQLLGSFKGFHLFKSLGQRSFQLTIGQQFSIQVASDVRIDITVEALEAEEITLLVRAQGREHRVKAKPNLLFFEAIRWKGRVIILAMRPSL